MSDLMPANAVASRPVAAATYLLMLVGLLGALDIAVYHTHAQQLRQQPSAGHELITHSLRGPTYAILFAVVPNFAAHGAWFVVMLALFAFDIAISIWDFSIESKSRKPMGGLPTGEYVLHSIIAMLFGAFVACYCNAGLPWAGLDTEWVYAPAVPWPVQVILAVMSAGVLWSGLADARAVVRLRRAST